MSMQPKKWVLTHLSLGLLFVASTVSAAEPAPALAENVCIECHGQLPERLGEPVKLWRESIHAENGIACNSCHGGDPKDAANAMDRSRGFLGVPKQSEIPAFCGRCHVGVLKDYLASAHGRALGKGGPTCVTCHGNHLVRKGALTLINEKTCSQCHSFERARLIRDAMRQTEERIVGIDVKVAAYKAQGIDTERLEKGLFAVRNRFHTLFHEVNTEKVRSESAQMSGELARQEKELKGIEEVRRQRKIAGGGVIGATLVIALLFHLMKKSYDEKD